MGFEFDLYSLPSAIPEDFAFLEGSFFAAGDQRACDALQVVLAAKTEHLSAELRAAFTRLLISLHHRTPERVRHIREGLMHAQGQVAGQAEMANNRAIGGAVMGAVLGAGLGAAVGGGRGAGIGAAAGAGLGTAGGAGYSADVQGGIQAQYDNAYAQCMYSKGNRVAGLPDPEPEPRVAMQQGRRRAPVRQAVRAPAARMRDYVGATAVPTDGGMKAPVPGAYAKPAQDE